MIKKFKYIKGNLRRGDMLRPLLTDTAPYEVPVIFSNDGFYRNMANISGRSVVYNEIVKKIITESVSHYTVPLRYKVSKDESSLRGLSLPHPSAQYKVCNFYDKYGSLIPYYCSLSAFSLRRPVKTGATFYFKSSLSGLTASKRASIETEELEKFTKNPASYFTYSSHDRLYKFFSSADYVGLEKRYSHMHLLDVSKCFASIYTHSVEWAIKGDQHSKDNRKALTFGSQFDQLMQKMNYNETAGICVGPEVSRIFAEIIFSRIDKNILEQAAQEDLKHGRDYSIRRYVDDYIVFSNHEDEISKLTRIISGCLTEYKMNLNEQKIKKYKRPFFTEKSHTTLRSHVALETYLSSFIEAQGKVLFAKRIFKPHRLQQNFINLMKSACAERGVSYDSVSNYIISVLSKRIEKLTSDYQEASALDGFDPELYPAALLSILESSFFMYTVNPTVGSSYNLSRSILLAKEHIERHNPKDLISFTERCALWTRQLMRALSANKELSFGKLPIEAINIVLTAAEVDDHFIIQDHHQLPLGISPRNFGYFSIISALYVCKNRHENSWLKSKVSDRILEIISNGTLLRRCSEKSHLFLDTLSCPYLALDVRKQILRSALSNLEIPPLATADEDALLEEFAQHPWFVDWNGISLLAMVRKKELSAVY